MEFRRARHSWSFGSPLKKRNRNLLQRSVDRAEHCIQVRSETVNNRNDSQCDAGCDQAVFNRGSPRLIGQKVQQGFLQCCLLNRWRRGDTTSGINKRSSILDTNPWSKVAEMGTQLCAHRMLW